MDTPSPILLVVILIGWASLLAGCASTRSQSQVSQKSKLQQVQMQTETGPYAYLRSGGGGYRQ